MRITTGAGFAGAYALVSEGRAPVVVDSVFPLDDFQNGLERLEGRKVFGKVVITF